MNIDFLNLKAHYLIAKGEEKEAYLNQMRDNIKKRYGNETLHTKRYTHMD